VPYTQLPQIDDRKSEKMAVLLTAENMAGLLALAVPVYLATTSWAMLPRLVVLLLAATGGVALTVPVGGLALYRRLLWRLRGALWLLLRGEDIRPEQLPGAARRPQRSVVLPAHGVARIVRRTTATAVVTPACASRPQHPSRAARHVESTNHADRRA
jgi:hypothetical protein